MTDRPNATPGALNCPLPFSKHETVQLAHGGGGRLSGQLLERIFLPRLTNPELARLHDGARVTVEGQQVALTTDSYVIRPLFFPGGDIGSLAVHGTVNDLAMCGARAVALTVGFILEEGLPLALLERIVDSLAAAARDANAPVVTGDTKVVDRGRGDGVYLNTSGIGILLPEADICPSRVRPGDVVLLSGAIAAHGVSVMSVREGLEFESPIVTDSAPLGDLVAKMLQVGGRDIHLLRDPTRGGVASSTNEVAKAAGVGLVLSEAAVPVAEPVRGACEMLGLDPLYVANEGKLLCWVAPDAAEAVLAAMRSHPLGREATRLGEAVAEHPGTVVLRSAIGGRRVVDLLSGEQLPRIC